MAIDEEALLAAYRRLETPLYNAIYRLLWESSECQDLIHDAFLRIWARRDTVDAARVDALLWSSALNLARNRLRWRSLWRWVGLEAREPEASDDPPHAATTTALRKALTRLPRAQREIVLLTEFGGFDTSEVASLLDIPPGTVASRKHHALRRLREWLGDGDE